MGKGSIEQPQVVRWEILRFRELSEKGVLTTGNEGNDDHGSPRSSFGVSTNDSRNESVSDLVLDDGTFDFGR